MTTDIFTSSAVDLVIFTVVNPKDLSTQLWDDSLVSFGPYKPDDLQGLSLFVVTLPADADIYPNLQGIRVLPGGYLGKDETLQHASRRIAKERLGLSLNAKIRQLGTFDEPNRDPRGRVLSFAYWAMVDFSEIRKYLGGRDQIGLELVNSPKYMALFQNDHGVLSNFDGVCRFGNRTMPSPTSFRGHAKTLTKDLPFGRILGLDHDEMVFYAWRALRHAFSGKLDPFRYLGLNPLGFEFRISELHEFTEVCRGEYIQRDYFKRQLLNNETYLINTGKTDRSKPGKPTNLYRHVNDNLDVSDTE